MNIVVQQSAELRKIKPIPLSVIADNIPQYLKDKKQWCLWKYEFRNGNWTKVPYQINGFRAKSNKKSTWNEFGVCYTFLTRGAVKKYDGVGYFLSDGEIGIDGDKCITDGVISDDATTIIKKINSYTEYSPSAIGFRIFALGKLPPKDRRNGIFEVYDESSPRFLTVTGHRIEGTSSNVENRQNEVLEFHKKYIHRDKKTVENKTSKTHRVPLHVEGIDDENEVLTLCLKDAKFKKLYDGDDSDYQDDTGRDDTSRGDGAFVFYLARFTRDEKIIDSIYRESKRYRDKWDSRRGDITYGEMCIRDALENVETTIPQDKIHEMTQSDWDMEVNPKKTRLFRIDDILKLSDPEWIVKNHLTEQSLVCVYGSPGAGKSFLAIDWALCVSSGISWQGCYDVKNGPVLYVYSEGFSGLKRRLQAWRKHHGEIDSSKIVFDKMQNNLCEIEDAETLLKEAVSELGDYPRLIVVDTLAMNFKGNESSAEDMNSFISSLNYLKKESEATVIVVHHEGKDRDKGMRGSSGLPAACDSVIRVGIDKTRSLMTVDCEKSKDCEPFETYKLKKEVITVGQNKEGDEITSCVWILNNVWLTRYQLLKAEQKEVFASIIKQYGSEPFSYSDFENIVGKSITTAKRYLRDLNQFIDKEKRDSYKVNPEAMAIYQLTP